MDRWRLLEPCKKKHSVEKLQTANWDALLRIKVINESIVVNVVTVNSWGGCVAQRSILASHPVAPGMIPGPVVIFLITA